MFHSDNFNKKYVHKFFPTSTIIQKHNIFYYYCHYFHFAKNMNFYVAILIWWKKISWKTFLYVWGNCFFSFEKMENLECIFEMMFFLCVKNLFFAKIRREKINEIAYVQSLFIFIIKRFLFFAEGPQAYTWGPALPT